ncbi:DUF4097 domain-containing protein [Streptomyces bambusae]|uniref:DUF4097 family beta strand repeat-containing protein n=1 Tax=Streptomyces bambusae TaxID=1550616 RepID=UPI001CFFD041|nr:DUF4097 domain-containing protein [Streptomyces bambusae]MCB5169160.1 DUF4097 domain-containing protein [Streptomyces bambusae]
MTNAQPTWSVSGPRKLLFEEPVTELCVRLVSGAVNVVGAEVREEDGTARLEVSEVEGPPLAVDLADGVLTVTYEDLQWSGIKNWLDGEGRRRSAVVSLTVPPGTRVRIGAVAATTVVSGITGPADVLAVNGDVTLVGLAGPVRANTVTGAIDAQSVTGGLQVRSVSGAITVVDGADSVRAESVSGDLVLDLDPAGRPAEICVTSVSGEVAIRLPHPADARVDANTAGGTVTNAFDDLRVSGRFGAKRITGTLGAGTGSLKATTLSGAIALLRRPDTEPGSPADPLALDKKVL